MSTAGKARGVCVGQVSPGPSCSWHGCAERVPPAGITPRRLQLLSLTFPWCQRAQPELLGALALWDPGGIGHWWPVCSCPGQRLRWPLPAAIPAPAELHPHFTQCWFWLHHLPRACRANAFPVPARRARGCLCSPELPHGLCQLLPLPSPSIQLWLLSFPVPTGY